MTKHTPGPWEFGVNPKWTPDSEWAVSRELVVRPRGEFPHGLWVADCGLSVDDEQMANARLIAAAPDLLAVAQEAIDWLKAEYHEAGSPHAELVAELRAAIAKAEGK